MPWSDLSQVTAALVRLLELYIAHIDPGQAVTVVSTPPDQLGSNVNTTLSVYLYHVRETAESQNRLGAGNTFDVATVSMGLDLFYVLTAHHRTQNTFDAAIEQRLLGYALKTFHDVQVITDATQVGGNSILVGAGQRGRDARLNIELRKLDPEQAFAIWTTGERQFTRLAAYYQVGLVLLEPEPTLRMPGVVLSLGAFVVPTGSVALSGSRSNVSFALPAAAGGGTQDLRAEPARPGLRAVPAPDTTFTLLGQNLRAGVRRRLVLRSARWPRLVPPAEDVPVDPTLNLANGWTVDFSDDRIDIQLGASVTFKPPGGGPPRTIAIMPGTYLAHVETVIEEQTIGATVRTITSVSNQVAITVAPRIAGHTLLGADRIRIDLDPVTVLNAPAPLDVAVQIVVDGRVYVHAAGAVPAAGEFVIDTALANRIELTAAFNTAQPGLHILRVTVEGADAQPYWIEIP